MSKTTITKPEPVITHTLCSECGLDWALHGDDPTTDDCIRLLKAELYRERLRATPQPYPVRIPFHPLFPYGGPYSEPRWRIHPPLETICGVNESKDFGGTISYNTPRRIGRGRLEV